MHVHSPTCTSIHIPSEHAAEVEDSMGMLVVLVIRLAAGPAAEAGVCRQRVNELPKRKVELALKEKKGYMYELCKNLFQKNIIAYTEPMPIPLLKLQSSQIFLVFEQSDTLLIQSNSS